MQVIEYQNAETEFAVAAAEMEHNNQAANGPSGEAKQDSTTAAATRELVELKVLLGKVSSERDELREETTRLRRIASTLTAPTAPATTASASGAPAGVRVVAKRGTTAVSKAVTPAAAAASASGSRVAGQKEKQQAATNVLVIELNAEVIARHA